MLAACLCLFGCSNGDRPPLGLVTGTISVDGKPTAGVGVIFSTKGFRSSSGITNEKGEYELTYLKDVNGAVVGDHSVRIKFVQGESASSKKPLPKKYNRNTELTAKVERGRNRIDFDLQTD